MIKAVLIDVDNTILDFDKCSEFAIQAACREFDMPFEHNLYVAFERINTSLWKELEKGLLTSEQLFSTRWNIIFGSMGMTISDGVAFENCFHKHLNLCAIPEDGANDALEYIASKYPVYAATNADFAQQRNRLQSANMLKYFSGLFVSEQIGFLKPRKEFFDVCFSRLNGLSPSDALLIGDSLSADIDGAKQYGMQTCWYNRKSISSPPDVADFVITSLSDISKII